MFRKKFKNLSTSQKNRRLRNMYKSLQNNDIKSKNIETSEPCTSSSSSSKNFVSATNKLCTNEVSIFENCGYNQHVINESDSDINDNDRAEENDINILNNERKMINFKEQFIGWLCEYNITHRATAALLKILKHVNINELQDLPLDPRTLLNTPKNTVVREVPPGRYFHYGLRNALIDTLKTIDLSRIQKNIEININIDGLPLAKSSKSQFYPILGEIFPKIAEPFVIGAYHGYNKPACPNLFLKEFIKEYIFLHENGFEFNEMYFQITIRCVVCDSPARSFVKCIKACNGYFGCSKCMQEGDYSNHRMLFLDINANLRTDENFIN